MIAPPLVDRAVLDDLFDQIGAEATRAVLELFVGEAVIYRARIADAAARPGEAALREQARGAAHTLKSGAGQIGAAALCAAAAEFERAAAEGASELAPAAAALEQCATETMTALGPFLAQA